MKAETKKQAIEIINQIKKFPVDIKITRYTKTRSVSQNRLYWLYLKIIESETGNFKDDMHDFFKSKFLKSEINIYFGENFVKSGSTKELNTKEFTEYLDKIKLYVSEYVELPDPNELNLINIYEFYKDLY